MECIICFNDINITNNNYIILECCKQNIHIDCLKQWISTNYNINRDISLCIYCKSNNDIINDMVNNVVIDIEERVSNNSNSNNSNNSNVSNISDSTNIPINNNPRRYFPLIFAVLFVCFCLIAPIFLFL